MPKVRVKKYTRLGPLKEYKATVYWRISGETLDRWGNILAKSQAEARKVVRREYRKGERRQIRKIKLTKGRRFKY